MGKMDQSYVSCGRASCRGYEDQIKPRERSYKNADGEDVNTFGGAYHWGKQTGYATRGEDLQIGQFLIKDPVEVTGNYTAFKVEKNLNLAFPHPAEVIHTDAHPASEPPWRRGLAVRNSAQSRGDKGRRPKSRAGLDLVDSDVSTAASSCVNTPLAHLTTPGESAKQPYGGKFSAQNGNSVDVMSPNSAPMMSHVNSPMNLTAGGVGAGMPGEGQQRKRLFSAKDPSHGNPNYKADGESRVVFGRAGNTNLPTAVKQEIQTGSKMRQKGHQLQCPAGSQRHGHE
jgi:hypothetical protein